MINVNLKPIRDGYGEALVELGKEDSNIVVLTCDLAESTRVLEFAKLFPERFIEVGVAEQNMAGIAAGIAHEGKIPFISSYAVFSPGRNWDQIRVSICYSKNNVKIAGHHTGLSVGPDGATHQALEDIALMQVLPNMVVLAPADALEAKKTTIAAAKFNGPVYLRFAREKTALFTTHDTPFEIGKAFVFRKGKDCTIGAVGPEVYYALEAADELSREGIECEVINFASIKPLDEKALIESVKKTGCLVSAEEHQISGGLGSVLSDCLVKNFPVPQEFVGMPDYFGESGEPNELIEKWGMDKKAIKAAVHKVMKRK